MDLNKTVDKPPFATNGTGLVKNLNAHAVDGKSADDFVAKSSLLFAVVAADGTIGANRGIPANGRATVAATGGNEVFTVPISGDVSQRAATANPPTSLPARSRSPRQRQVHGEVTEVGTTP